MEHYSSIESNEILTYLTMYQISRKCEIIYGDRKQIGGCLGMGGIKKFHEETCRDDGMYTFIILMAVMVSQKYIYIKIFQAGHF